MPDEPKFPGGSRKRVSAAGERLRERTHTEDDVRVIEEWRAAHSVVLNNFSTILRARTRGQNVSRAQRLKRAKTIIDKLSRFPKMQLVRMDDVAGCRLIFGSINELRAFRSQLHGARFDHKLRNSDNLDKYDYINRPKSTGYRGVHDIYEYNVRSARNAHLNGLYVEIQYRTLVQHAWATAVEVIGFVTESQPKFQKGDKRFELAMTHASEILSRTHEAMLGPLPHLTYKRLLDDFLALDSEISLLRTLRGLAQSKTEISGKRNSVLNMSPEGELVIHSFRDAADAIRKLFELERQFPQNDVVLVRADSTEEVRLAFRNYFSDVNEFLRLIDEGVANIANNYKVLDSRPTKPADSDGDA
jgi:ppGpp synthetase/RelA/SpoT-type nucleotidyltranferase